MATVLLWLGVAAYGPLLGVVLPVVLSAGATGLELCLPNEIVGGRLVPSNVTST